MIAHDLLHVATAQHYADCPRTLLFYGSLKCFHHWQINLKLWSDIVITIVKSGEIQGMCPKKFLFLCFS